VGQHPLLRFLSLDTSDLRLGFAAIGVPFVHLLYCWRCDVGDLDYFLHPDGSVTLPDAAAWSVDTPHVVAVRAQVNSPDHDFPYPDYPPHFPPRGASLTRLPADEQQRLLATELGEQEPPADDAFRHQVGGLPRLAQGADYIPSCNGCGQPMAFVAAIADDCADPRGFTDNGSVQVLYFLCSGCRRMHAMNVVD
jgi:hypothetical protein